MKKIKLAQGYITLVDNEDFEYLNQWKWRFNRGYAARSQRYGLRKEGKHTWVYLHRIILNPPQGLCTDHINGDRLDNRKQNLRIATNSQNQMNKRLLKKNTSGFVGITYYPPTKKWASYIYIENKKLHLGYFSDKQEAIKKRDEASKQYFGEFARLNLGSTRGLM